MAKSSSWVALAGGVMTLSSLNGRNGVYGLIRPHTAQVGDGHVVIVGGYGGGGDHHTVNAHGRNGIDRLIRPPSAEVGHGHVVIATSTNQPWQQYVMATSLPWAERWQPLIWIGLCSLLLGLL